jgi:MYXO-CTERM domain-containing protein
MPVESVATLKALGVTTYVVGFGDAVDALALNQMAVEAGTALAGCDATGADPTAANPCYHRAEPHAELDLVLQNIALELSAETCDGVDNDCDGAIDEAVTRTCANECGAGTQTCSAGTWGACAGAGSADVCDGIDNDCDGTVDPGCDCTPGTTQACGGGEVTGLCEIGEQSCGADGVWGACLGVVEPADEVCNGEDDDCDGLADEDGVCDVPQDGDVSGCSCRAPGQAAGRGTWPGALGGLLLAGFLVRPRRRRRI